MIRAPTAGPDRGMIVVMRGDEYQARFDALEAAGNDIQGEAALVRSYDPEAVLDAGCGTGRVAIQLARQGIDVVGLDRDPVMLGTARQLAPDLDWRLDDLAEAELEDDRFDVAVLAGNVLIFTEPGTEAAVIANVARSVRRGGVLLAGFSLRPGDYDLGQLDVDASAAGLELTDRWATWDRASYDGGDYAVSAFNRS